MSILGKLAKFLGRWAAPRRTTVRNRPYRLQFELLEDRLAPANFTWRGGQDMNNSWNYAANWVGGGGGVPGSGDTATIGSPLQALAGVPICNVLSDVTVGQLTIRGAHDLSVAVGDTLTVTNANGQNGELAVNGGILIVNGTVNVLSSVSMRGNPQLIGPALGGATVTVNGTLTAGADMGMVGSSVMTIKGSVSVTGDVEVNGTARVFVGSAGSAGSLFATGDVKVTGTSAQITAGVDGSMITAHGRVRIAADNEIVVAANTSIISTVSAAGTFQITQNGVAQVSGDFTSAGPLVFRVDGATGGELISCGTATIAGSLVVTKATPAAIVTRANVYHIITAVAVNNQIGLPAFALIPNPNHRSIVTATTWTLQVPPNNAPVGINRNIAVPENGARSLTSADFGFSDPDDMPTPDQFKAVQIATLPDVGTLTNDGVAVAEEQFISIADINAGLLVFTPAANTFGIPYTSFLFRVQDDGGTDNDGIDTDTTARTMTIDVANAVFTVTTAGTSTLATSGSSSSTLSMTGDLPSGLSFADNGDGTFTISGTSATGTVGTYIFYISVTENGVTGDPEAFTLIVIKATPTITWSNPADITYGAALSSTQLNATASFAGSSLAGTFVYTPAAGTVLNAGNNQTLLVTFTPTDTADYTTATQTVSINVSPATLTVTADDQSKIYGDANPTLTATIAGYVNGDNSSVVSGVASLSTTATAGSGVGAYAITAAIGDLAASNYTFTFTAGTLTINTKALTVSGVSADNKIYDASATATLSFSSPSLSGIVGTDTVSLDSSSYSASFGDANAGTGKPVTVSGFSLSGADAGNYTLTQPSLTADITKATPVVTWANPADITNGTALSSTQLNASADVAGTYSYTPDVGTVLGLGANQTLSVTFTPTDATNYTAVTQTVSINVVDVNPPTFSDLVVDESSNPVTVSGSVADDMTLFEAGFANTNALVVSITGVLSGTVDPSHYTVTASLSSDHMTITSTISVDGTGLGADQYVVDLFATDIAGNVSETGTSFNL